MRRYEVAWLDPEGSAATATVAAPATAALEAAAGAFAHGTLIHTDQGPVAVEDLDPGATLALADGRRTTLSWKGAMTLVPGADPGGGANRLYRVVAGALGPARPARDLILGPHARLFRRGGASRAYGAEAGLVPVGDYVDGDTVAEIRPVTAVRVYHLACAGQAAVMADGVAVPSYHPGPDAAQILSTAIATALLRLFPAHDRLADFGPATWPRLDAAEA